MLKSLYDYSDQEIGLILIGGSFVVAVTFCLGLCGFLHSVNRHRHNNRRRGSSLRNRRAHSSSSDELTQQQQQQHLQVPKLGAGRGGGSYGLVRQQSQSVVRGEHPIAFMLPTVPPSEPCSEFSDLESMATTYSTSPAISAATSASGYPSWRRLRGINPHKTVHHARPRQREGRTGRHHRRQGMGNRRYSPLLGEDSSFGYGEAETEPEFNAGEDDEVEEYRMSSSLQPPSLFSYNQRGRHRKSRSATTSPRSFDVGSDVIRESLLEAHHSNNNSDQGNSTPQQPRRGDVFSNTGAVPKRRTESEVVHEEESSDEFDDDDDSDRNKEGAGDEVKDEDDDGRLGFIRARFRVDWQNKLVISEIFLRGLKANLLQSGKVSVRIKCYPESGSIFKTGTMSVFDDKVLLLDPITLPVDNTTESPNYVIKLSVMDVPIVKSQSRRASRETTDGKEYEEKTSISRHENKPGSNASYGHSLVNLSPHLPLKDGSLILESEILPKVTDQMTEIFSDTMEVSLCYDATAGRLTLGIIQARLTQLTSRRQKQMHGLEAMLYTKVTLYEGTRTMKAKKTRPVGFNDRPQFHETFNIVVPEDYLNRVSCLIGLHCKNKTGSKVTLGRVCLGSSSPKDVSASTSSGASKKRGQIHWERMTENPEGTVIQWHYLE